MPKPWILLLAFLFAACNEAPETESPTQVETRSKNSDAFNRSVQNVLDSYYSLSEAFVKWDSAAVPTIAKDLVSRIDSLRPDSLEKEISAIASGQISKARSHALAISGPHDITARRYALNELTEQLYAFLGTVQYDREKLYLQQCPMAFNDEETGLWISKEESIRNPYLGLYHPRYGKGMLECGETKEIFNFTGTK